MRLIEINYQPIEWMGDRVRILDQTRLPGEEVYLELTDFREVASAIKELRVRGAPAIGVAAGYGMALTTHYGTRSTHQSSHNGSYEPSQA